MLKRLFRASKLSVICLMTVVLAVLTLPAISGAMVMSPDLIILNASPMAENNQDIQAIIYYPDHRPVNLDDAESTLSIADNEYKFDDIGVDFCYTDHKFLISFDREEIQNDPEVQELANKGTVDVTVTVTFYYVEAETGQIDITTITGTGEVEILAPGKKSSKE